jgi:hypothetical protein
MNVMVVFKVFSPPHTKEEQEELVALAGSLPYDKLQAALEPVLKEHGFNVEFGVDVDIEQF